MLSGPNRERNDVTGAARRRQLRITFRLFYAAGLAVRMHTYPSNHRIHPHMLRDVDRWVQQSLDEEA